MPSVKRRVHSVSGRHHDDRCRNAPGVFLKASETFLNFRSLPSSNGNFRSTCRHRTKFFEVHYTPFTLILIMVYFEYTITLFHTTHFIHSDYLYSLGVTVLVIIKFTKFAVALRLRCRSCKLIF